MPQGLGHSIKTFVQISLPVNSLWASRYIIISYLLSSPGGGGVRRAIICYNRRHHRRDSHHGLLGSK